MNCTHGFGCFILAAGDICPVCRQIVAAAPMRQATSGEVGGGRAWPELAPRTIAASAPIPATSPQPSLPGRGTPSAHVRHGADAALSSARATDPDTAHDAALTAANADHRAVYAAILAALHEHGPLTDYHLSLHVARRTGAPILRTSVGKRRGELRDMGLICNSGHRAKTDTNTTAIRWALTPAGEQARSNAA